MQSLSNKYANGEHFAVTVIDIQVGIIFNKCSPVTQHIEIC